MEFFMYMIIFFFLFNRTELRPIDESVTLKLPIAIESGMNIILGGMLNNEHDQISLTFSGENMSAKDEYHVKYIPEKKKFLLTNDGVETSVSLPKPKIISYPSPFVLQFNARTVLDDDTDKHVMELYYEGAGIVRGSLGEFINFHSFDLIDSITVKGFSNVHNVTFSFKREDIKIV
ncbi:uncharacterized protein LOC124532259 [Vanessa cardui]|uniref:uncharacterized protein LOC124532259 n=1 Tax=Vanessa cardui TaxID=171605 RepID=UPI001F143323|nr:uncharacterized protein LOC124532259 [Vanessa cardui]